MQGTANQRPRCSTAAMALLTCRLRDIQAVFSWTVRWSVNKSSDASSRSRDRLSAVSRLSFLSLPLLIGIAFTSAPTSKGIVFRSGAFARELAARRRSSAPMMMRGAAPIIGNGGAACGARQSRDQKDRAQQQVDYIVRGQIIDPARSL